MGYGFIEFIVGKLGLLALSCTVLIFHFMAKSALWRVYEEEGVGVGTGEGEYKGEYEGEGEGEGEYKGEGEGEGEGEEKLVWYKWISSLEGTYTLTTHLLFLTTLIWSILLLHTLYNTGLVLSKHNYMSSRLRHILYNTVLFQVYVAIGLYAVITGYYMVCFVCYIYVPI